MQCDSDYYGAIMSKKHNQRTRAEILTKRFELETLVQRRQIVVVSPRSRSKYTPHIGDKEQERAKRCRMDFLHGPHSTFSDNERSAPTLSQMSKRAYEEQAQVWQQEYDSVF
jgi:hypothetical protein